MRFDECDECDACDECVEWIKSYGLPTLSLSRIERGLPGITAWESTIATVHSIAQILHGPATFGEISIFLSGAMTSGEVQNIAPIRCRLPRSSLGSVSYERGTPVLIRNTRRRLPLLLLSSRYRF
jgi:hypothetical protein